MTIVSEYLNGISSKSYLQKLYNISLYSLEEWIFRYEKDGITGLQTPKTWRKYTKELKLQAVIDYLSGNYSIKELIRKYEISDTRVLRSWIKKYNSHSELKDTGKGLSATMTKSRKTTFKERIEIVEYCLANDLNYQNTSDLYKVSYQQVYTWVKKYKADGEDALQDRRGKAKVQEKLTNDDILALKLKKLETENKRLKAENLLLKKLDELERK